MNCLLVYPNMPDTMYALRHFLSMTGKKAPFPPLGLMTVAAMLPSDWNLKLIDMNIEDLTPTDLAWADFVFLSAMNVQEESVRDIIARCVAANTKIVAGGPLFTHEYERFTDVDYFILNEAEITLPRFLADLEKGEAKNIYKSPAFADVTATPLPRYDLVDMNHYMYAILQYSRGCPYLCDFCDVTALFGRKPRTKTPEQVIAELDLIRKHSRGNFVMFADDNLIGNKKILKLELLPALIEWQKTHKHGFYFATQVTINLADDQELMRLMSTAGFRNLFIGIETPQEESLKDSRKTQNLKRDMLATIHKLQNHGFLIYGGFILGFDSDTPASFDIITDFIQESGIAMPIVNILKAPPGTELFTRMKNEGRLIKDFAFEEGDTNIKTVMDEAELLQGFIKVLDGIYSPENIYERLITFSKSFRYPRAALPIKSMLGPREVLTALQILFNIGYRSPISAYYWKFLKWTWKNNKKYIENAIIQSLFMHQMYMSGEKLKLEANKRLQEIAQNPPIREALPVAIQA